MTHPAIRRVGSVVCAVTVPVLAIQWFRRESFGMSSADHDQIQDRLPDGTQDLDIAECWSLLAGEDVGRLAVSIADHPDIFPINYVVDRESIVFRTAAGTKLAASVLGKGVSFEIDRYDAIAGEAWSVVIKGYAREIEDSLEYFEADDLPLFPWHASAKPNIVRVIADVITGRRFHVVERDAPEMPSPDHEQPQMPTG